MCSFGPHRHSIFCIMPPYVLREVVMRGNDAQRAAAMRTLAADNTFRIMRATALPSAASPASLMVAGQKQRTVYDVGGTQNLPGTVVRAEGQAASGDPTVDEAYDGLGATYDFYWDVFNRNSIDGDGMPLNAHVHFGQGYNNAFWDGQRMVFGDGDGQIFQRFTIAVDVIGHELSHGVVQDEGPLFYVTQSGALNESFADVFGSMVKQRLLNQRVDEADWLIGAGLFADGIKGQALRSMAAPGTAFDDPLLGKDPQPGHMHDYVDTFDDNGGVHINSGIPNRAFYQTAMSLGGYAWERAGRIWYDALRDSRLRPDATFLQFAKVTVANAIRTFGQGSEEEGAVRAGWSAVGLDW